jgi:hypothetical protein
MLVGNEVGRPQGSDIQGLLADLLEDKVSRLGSRLEFRSAASSVPGGLGGLSVPGRWERRQPQADPRRAFLCLQALGPEKPVRQDRTSAPQRTPDPSSSGASSGQAPGRHCLSWRSRNQRP